MDHPSEETLKRFAAGTATREENRAVVSHLVKGCLAPGQAWEGRKEHAVDRT
jgi:hypothetical protein